MNPSISAIIIDDERSARRSLQAFIQKYCPQIKIVAEAENIVEAELQINTHHPQLIFLDIEMPGGNAFDLLEKIQIDEIEIVFVTAFSEYAVRAFELSAAHYLLKPISIEALVSAVQKVVRHLQDKSTVNHSRILLENLSRSELPQKKIVLPLLDGFELVALGEITYISALDNFSQIHTTQQRRITVCRKLKYFESHLSSLGFYRIHRSHIVNLNCIQRYYKGKGGYVILEDGTELDVAQGRKQGFMDRFLNH